MINAIQDMVMTSQTAELPLETQAPQQSFAAIFALLAEPAGSPADNDLATNEMSAAVEEEEEQTVLGGRAMPELTKEIKEKEETCKDSKCCNFTPEPGAGGIVGILEGFGLLDQIEAASPVAQELGTKAGITSENSAPQQSLQAGQDLASNTRAWMPPAGPTDFNLPATLRENESSAASSRADLPDASSLENANKITPHADLLASPATFDQARLARFFGQALARPARPQADRLDGQTNLPLQEPAVFLAPDQVLVQEEAALEPRQIEHNLSLLVESLTARTSLEGQACIVTLKPEHLGKVRIQLSLDKGDIRALVQVESTAAGHLIKDQAGQLEDMLQARGLNLAALEVSQEAVLADSGYRQQQQGQARPGPARLKNLAGLLARLESGQPYEQASPDRLKLYNSVEFLA